MSTATLPVVVCDCTHPASPTVFTPGYAVDKWGRSLCYDCAAERDFEYAAAIQPGDPPLLAYVSGLIPEPHSRQPIDVTTWAGVILGTGYVYRSTKHDSQMRVVVTIRGRKFWGRTPTRTGTYTQLRPYRNESTKEPR